MRKVAVLTTSTGCLDYYKEPHDIGIIRIKVILDGKTLEDGTEIRADEFYKMLRDNPDLVPKTSQPGVGELTELFESIHKEGYDEIFVTTISSELSGTYNSASVAAKSLEGKVKVTIFDTKTVCFSEGKFALDADRLFKEGKTTEEVIAYLEDLKTRNTIFFVVDSLTYLVKNGRLTGASAFLGKLLKIKPILQVQGTGQIISIEKTRSLKKAITKMLDKIKEYTKGREFEANILYTGNLELKEQFVEILKKELNITGLLEAPATPVVGAHIGIDIVGIGIFLK